MAKKRRRPPPSPDPDSPDPDDSLDPVRFPFGDTGTGSDWDIDSSDLRSSSLDGGLPNVPPGASAQDDASFESLPTHSDASDDDDDDGPFEDSEDDVGPPISDFGPISPSGPLVIVDEEGSSRYQASIVDDSARLAGSASARRKPGKKKKKPKKGQRSWREEAIDPDADVPTVSARRSRRAAAAPPPSRRGLLVVVGLALLALAGLAIGLEQRRQADLERLRKELIAKHEAELAKLRAANAAALKQEQGLKAAALDKQRRESAAQLARVRQEATKTGERAVQLALKGARQQAERERDRAVEAERERARQRARKAVEVELARARKATAREAERRVGDAVAKERKRGRAALEKQADAAEKRRLRELASLRKKLEAELKAATTRKEEEKLAKAIKKDKKDVLDEVEKKKGGSPGDDVDDWDEKYFGDGDDDDDGKKGDGAEKKGDDDDDDDEGDGDGDGEALHPVDRAWKWLKDNVHGSVGYKNLTHFSRGPAGGPHDLRTTRHELRVELEFRDWLLKNDDGTIGLRAVIELDVRVDDDKYAVGLPKGIDDEERRRPILTTQEAYLALAIDWFEIRAGYQIFAWGTGDLVNPTDNLNPIDFSDLFDSRRIPVMATTIELDFEKVSFELISIPTFTRSRLPLKNKRFDFLRNSPLPILTPDDPESEFQNMQWGARAEAHLFGWDFSISGFSGFNDIPSPSLVLLANPVTLVIDPIFDKQYVLGADFATTLGIFGAEGELGEVLKGIQIHGEVAHFWSEGDRAEDYLQYLIGFNYEWTDVIAEHDLKLVVEYASDYRTKAADGVVPQVDLNRIFRSAIVLRIEYAVDDDLSFALNAAAILHGDDNFLLAPVAKWNVTDNLQVELGGQVFLGPDETFFGQFKRDGRVMFMVKAVF